MPNLGSRPNRGWFRNPVSQRGQEEFDRRWFEVIDLLRSMLGRERVVGDILDEQLDEVDILWSTPNR
jgi:hypothetical protein